MDSLVPLDFQVSQKPPFFVRPPRTNEPDEMSDTVASSTDASGGRTRRNIPSTKMPGRPGPTFPP